MNEVFTKDGSRFTDEDIPRIHQINLENPQILSAICKLLEIYLTTEYFSTGADVWHLPGGIKCNLKEAILYVKGYAAATDLANSKLRHRLSQIRHIIDDIKPFIDDK